MQNEKRNDSDLFGCSDLAGAMIRLSVPLVIAMALTTNASGAQSICSDDAQIYRVGDHQFSIPMSYITGLNPKRVVASKRCGGTWEVIGIDTLLPDFRPVPASAPEHKGGGPGQVVGVLITINPAGTTIDQRYLRARHGRPEKRNSAIGRQIGLKHYADAHPNGRDVFVDIDQGVAQAYLSCGREIAQIKYPFCHMYIAYSKDVFLDVSFGRSHLFEWKRIRNGVPELVKTFEAKAAKIF